MSILGSVTAIRARSWPLSSPICRPGNSACFTPGTSPSVTNEQFLAHLRCQAYHGGWEDDRLADREAGDTFSLGAQGDPASEPAGVEVAERSRVSCQCAAGALCWLTRAVSPHVSSVVAIVAPATISAFISSDLEGSWASTGIGALSPGVPRLAVVWGGHLPGLSLALRLCRKSASAGRHLGAERDASQLQGPGLPTQHEPWRGHHVPSTAGPTRLFRTCWPCFLVLSHSLSCFVMPLPHPEGVPT